MLMIHDENEMPSLDTSQWRGFVVDFWQELSQKCHFNYTIRLPGQVSDDLSSFDFNESTTTMRNYGQANRDVWLHNRSDIYMSSFYVNAQRLDKSLMTQPLMNTPLQLGELASVDKAGGGGIFEPFHWHTWVMWFATTGVAAFVFWFLDAGTAGENFLRHKRADVRNLQENFWMSFWLSWSSLTGGNAHRPTTGLCRAFSGVWTFFCLIMIATYTANLAAWLTHTTLSTDIESFDHMQDSGKRLCVLKGTAYSRYLKDNWKGITIVERAASVWEEGGMVEALLSGDCDAFTDSGIYMHYAQHKRCNAMLSPDVVEWSPSNKCQGACQRRLMQHLLRTSKKIIMAPEKVEFGLQDNAIGLAPQHVAARDDLNFHIFDMRMSGELARLMKTHKLDRPPLECLGAGAAGDATVMDKIALRHLSIAFNMVFGSAGILILIKVLGTWRDGGQGHDLLIEFLNERYPRERFKPQRIVKEWEDSWQLRWTMHPLVARHLRAIDVDKMRDWAHSGSRIRNVDMVAWAKAHEHGDAAESIPHINCDEDSGTMPSTASWKLSRHAMGRNSIVELKKRGEEIHNQFAGEDYKTVFEAQKQLLLDTLVHISSDQLETAMRRRLFRTGGRARGVSKFSKTQVSTALTRMASKRVVPEMTEVPIEVTSVTSASADRVIGTRAFEL
eukprot:g2788.t1